MSDKTYVLIYGYSAKPYCGARAYADREVLIDTILAGHYERPLQVMLHGSPFGMPSDVSPEIARELSRRIMAEGKEVPPGLGPFLDAHYARPEPAPKPIANQQDDLVPAFAALVAAANGLVPSAIVLRAHNALEKIAPPQSKPAIVTHHLRPPIPISRFDWVAYRDGSESGPRGHGTTRQEAIADLLENEEQGQ